MEIAKTSSWLPSSLENDHPVRPIAVAGAVAGIEGGEALAAQRPVPRDDFTLSEFQPGSATRQEGIFVTRWAMAVTRTRAELMVVAQLAYWLGVAKSGKLRAKIRWRGYVWVAKSYGMLGRELLLTKDAVRGAVRSLKKRGILVDDGGESGRELPLYRLRPMAIAEAFAKASTMDEAMEDECDEE